MIARLRTVAFRGIDTVPIEVEAQFSGGVPAFTLVGLPDKAVAESRERVRAALLSLGLALPPKRILVNLSPADLPKEGSHFDLPILLALLVAMEVVDQAEADQYLALGELGLDGALRPVTGTLSAAMAASGLDLGLICPAANGGEAVWAGQIPVLAPPDLLSLVAHLTGTQPLARPEPQMEAISTRGTDLAEVKGQEAAKRALEVAAAGGHNLLMIGPPGSGKSMLAGCLPGILPPLTPGEALEVTMVHSVAGELARGHLLRVRPLRDPHHSASLPSLVGGGHRAKPGEVSLAHNGVLFLDELPEFQRPALEALRQPIESGRAVISRANHHVTYPARFQLVAAMNPCRCGYFGDAERQCRHVPKCAEDYLSRISGPILDRFDMLVEVPAVRPADLEGAAPGEPSAAVAARVSRARAIQGQRFQDLGVPTVRANGAASGQVLEQIATLEPEARSLALEAADRLRLSARAYHRVLRVARTLADLAGRSPIQRSDIAEALSWRRTGTIG